MPNRTDLRRGQVYHVHMDKPDRPVVIVSSDVHNAANRPFVVVVPCLSDAPPSMFAPMCVDVSTMTNPNGMHGHFRCDQIVPVSRSKFDGIVARTTLIGLDLQALDAALRRALSL